MDPSIEDGVGGGVLVKSGGVVEGGGGLEDDEWGEVGGEFSCHLDYEILGDRSPKVERAEGYSPGYVGFQHRRHRCWRFGCWIDSTTVCPSGNPVNFRYHIDLA